MVCSQIYIYPQVRYKWVIEKKNGHLHSTSSFIKIPIHKSRRWNTNSHFYSQSLKCTVSSVHQYKFFVKIQFECKDQSGKKKTLFMSYQHNKKVLQNNAIDLRRKYYNHCKSYHYLSLKRKTLLRDYEYTVENFPVHSIRCV